MNHQTGQTTRREFWHRLNHMNQGTATLCINLSLDCTVKIKYDARIDTISTDFTQPGYQHFKEDVIWILCLNSLTHKVQKFGQDEWQDFFSPWSFTSTPLSSNTFLLIMDTDARERSFQGPSANSRPLQLHYGISELEVIIDMHDQLSLSIHTFPLVCLANPETVQTRPQK